MDTTNVWFRGKLLSRVNLQQQTAFKTFSDSGLRPESTSIVFTFILSKQPNYLSLIKHILILTLVKHTLWNCQSVSTQAGKIHQPHCNFLFFFLQLLQQIIGATNSAQPKRNQKECSSEIITRPFVSIHNNLNLLNLYLWNLTKTQPLPWVNVTVLVNTTTVVDKANTTNADVQSTLPPSQIKVFCLCIMDIWILVSLGC